MSDTLKWGVLAVLAAVAAGYFGVIAAKAPAFARALLGRGFAERGHTEPGLTLRMRALGMAGLAASVACLGVALARIAG